MMATKTKVDRATVRRNTMRQWLDGIRTRNKAGVLKSADVVRAARDPKSPGHSHFTWDDTKAAEKCRLIEAGQLIRKVYIVENATGAKSPAFLSLLPDRERPGGGYRATPEVISSRALREQLVLTAKAELRAWTERYAMLSTLVTSVAAAAKLDGPPRKRKPK